MSNLYLLLRLLLTCLLTLIPVVWVHQLSLESFWQQRYHEPAPWHGLGALPGWQAGSRLTPALLSASNHFWQEMTAQPDSTQPAATPEVAGLSAVQSPPVNTAATPLATTTTAAAQATPAAMPAPTPLPVIQFKTRATLAPGQRIFFAGDSMMQGVAPHLARRLRQEHGIASIDLSRQSTGLSYPGAFNWPRTIADTLKQHPDIGVLAVFMGPNDPWDMPAASKGPFLKFRSTGWEALYRERIRQILASAREHKVDVVWLAPPLMRQTALSDKVGYISELYESEVLEAGEVFLSSNRVLGYQGQQYSDYSDPGSARQKMRSGDGIHFTPAGQRLLADALYQQLQIPAPANPALAVHPDPDPQ